MSPITPSLSITQVLQAPFSGCSDHNAVHDAAIMYAGKKDITPCTRAKLYAVAGWTLNCTERPLRALRYYREALKLARAAKDGELVIDIALSLATLLATYHQTLEIRHVITDTLDFLRYANIAPSKRTKFIAATAALRKRIEAS